MWVSVCCTPATFESRPAMTSASSSWARDPHDRDEVDVARAGVDLRHPVEVGDGLRGLGDAVGGGVHQDDRGDHSGHPRPWPPPPAPPGRRTRRRATGLGAAVAMAARGAAIARARALAPVGLRGRARWSPGASAYRRPRRRPAGRAAPTPPTPGAAGGLGPRRLGVHEPGAAGGEPAVQQPDLLGGRAAQRARPGQHHLRARAQRVDHRHRRHPARRDPGRGEPAVAHHRDLPAAAPVGPRPDQLVDGRERGQPLRPAQGQHQRRRAGRGGGPRSRTARGRRGRRSRRASRAQRRRRRGPSNRSAHGDDGGRVLGRVSAAPRTARRSGPARAARTGSPGRRAPGCAGCTARTGTAS